MGFCITARDRDTEEAEPKPKKQKVEKGEGGRGRSSGFLAPIPISEGLAKFLGAEDGKVSRADAVKRIWDYIKEHNLQVLFVVCHYACPVTIFSVRIMSSSNNFDLYVASW